MFKLLNHPFSKLYPWHDYSQFWPLLMNIMQHNLKCGYTHVVKGGTNILLIFWSIFSSFFYGDNCPSEFFFLNLLSGDSGFLVCYVWYDLDVRVLYG